MNNTQTGGINFGSEYKYGIDKLIEDVRYDMENKNNITYFELVYEISHGMKDPNFGEYTVVNSDDDRVYVFVNGDLISNDDAHIKFEDMYKNCNIESIKLKEKERPKKSKEVKFNKVKYYTEDEFLGKTIDDDIEDDFDNKDDFEYDTWDGTPREIAYERARKEVIDMLETKYMDLEMEMDACQGAMEGLNQAFEELDIYKKLVKYLGGNIEAHRQELTDKWFEKAHEESRKREEEQAKKDAIIKKLPLNMMKLIELKVSGMNSVKSADIIIDQFTEIQEKINEICDILINLKKL